MAQVEETHAVEATWLEQLLTQLLLHAPQLVVVLVVLISQPSCWKPLQSANPVLHLTMVQVRAAQPDVPLAAKHCLLHEPQLLTSESMWVSQPSAGWPLQSAHPGLQAAMVQVP